MVRSIVRNGAEGDNLLRALGAILVFLFFSLVPSYLARAQEQVQIFQLQHRSAEGVIEKIKPLLLEGERISAAESHLILIASPATLNAVEQLLAQYDRPLRQYLVQIRWLDGVVEGSGQLGYDAASGQSRVPSAGVLLGTGQRLSGQQLRVSEGEQAFISTGQDIPYNAKWAAWSGRYSSGYSSEIDFQRIRSGFSVLVRSVGRQRLQVDLIPQLMSAERQSGGRATILNLDRLATSIKLEPGTWLDLAGALPASSAGLQILSGLDGPLPAGRRLQLRIDEEK